MALLPRLKSLFGLQVNLRPLVLPIRVTSMAPRRGSRSVMVAYREDAWF